MSKKPQKIEDFGAHWRMSGEQRVYQNCQVCANSNWKVYVQPNSGMWICFVCNVGGRVLTAHNAERLRELLFPRREVGTADFEPVDVPFSTVLGAYANLVETRWNIKGPERYLLRRAGDRVLIPFNDHKGSVVGWTARSMEVFLTPKYLSHDGPKPLFVPGWNAQYRDADNPVVLVEGPMDAMSLHSRMNLNAAALGGKHLSDKQLAQLQILAGETRSRDLLIMLDQDALPAAFKLASKLRGKFPIHKVRVVPCPAKDPAEATTEELRGVLPCGAL